MRNSIRNYLTVGLILTVSALSSACTVLAVADAVVSTGVKAGSAVVGTAIDVTKAGVQTVTGSK